MGGPGVMGDPKIWGATGNGEAKPIIKQCCTYQIKKHIKY